MPYYVKNVLLVCLQVILLFIIYLIYFRPDGGSIESAYKILKGMNSNSFNYFEAHMSEISANKNYTVINGAKAVSTINFFSQCVRLNRPCLIQNIAKDWPAVKEDWAKS